MKNPTGRWRLCFPCRLSFQKAEAMKKIRKNEKQWRLLVNLVAGREKVKLKGQLNQIQPLQFNLSKWELKRVVGVGGGWSQGVGANYTYEFHFECPSLCVSTEWQRTGPTLSVIWFFYKKASPWLTLLSFPQILLGPQSTTPVLRLDSRALLSFSVSLLLGNWRSRVWKTKKKKKVVRERKGGKKRRTLLI